jgi:hypothetical protein
MFCIILKNGQDARSTIKFTICGTGKMPVPDKGKRKLTICGTGILPVASKGKRKLTICGTGILPVPDKGTIS